MSPGDGPGRCSHQLHHEYLVTMSCDTAAPTQQLSKSQLLCRHALAQPLRLHIGSKLAYIVFSEPWDQDCWGIYIYMFVCHAVVAGVTTSLHVVSATPRTVTQDCNSQQVNKADGSKNNVQSRSYI